MPKTPQTVHLVSGQDCLDGKTGDRFHQTTEDIPEESKGKGSQKKSNRSKGQRESQRVQGVEAPEIDTEFSEYRLRRKLRELREILHPNENFIQRSSPEDNEDTGQTLAGKETKKSTEEPIQNQKMIHQKFKEPPTFFGKLDEDAVDWLSEYENTGRYNRWGPEELRNNFWVYLEGTAKKWLKCLQAPAHWEDNLGPPLVPGLRSVFLTEFQPEGYGRYQENKLRNRRQGQEEPASDYYYDVMDLCRSVDATMPESIKLGHLFRGLKPALAEKIWIRRPPNCAAFLAEVKIHTEAEEFANLGGRGSTPVAILGTENKKVNFRSASAERREQARLEKAQKDEEFKNMIMQTLQDLKLEVVQLRIQIKD